MWLLNWFACPYYSWSYSMRSLCSTLGPCRHCYRSRPVASCRSGRSNCVVKTNSMITNANYSPKKAFDWRHFGHFDLATTKDSVAMIPVAGYLMQESMKLTEVPMTFDSVAYDDVRPSFEMPSMDHLDRVAVMIGAYFAAALRPYFVAKCANWTHFRVARVPVQT